MEIVQIEAQGRSDFGKKHNKVLRNSGRIPAIVYGGEDPVAISVTHKGVKPLVFTPDFKLAEINVNGKTDKCILKDIEFHPVSDEIVHIDFLRLVEGTPIKVEIPVAFKGKSPGVKAGGKLIQSIRKVKIKTLPSKITDKLYVDISDLELGNSVRIRDVELNEGMEILNPPATPVALVEVPRALKSAEAAAEGKEAPAAEEEAAPAE